MGVDARDAPRTDRATAPGDTRRVIRVLVAAGMLILLVLVVVLTFEAVRSNSRRSALRHHGVLVDARVTSCVGESAGMGAHVNGYRCNATFTVDGHRYAEQIRGAHAYFAIGQFVPAVVDPADPSTLSTRASVASTSPAWKAYIRPAVCLLLLLIALVFAGWIRRRARPARR
jgi:hypothetical protein